MRSSRKLLSEDGELALIVLALDPTLSRARTGRCDREVRKILADDLAGTQLEGQCRRPSDATRDPQRGRT